MLSLILPARNWPLERIRASVNSFLALDSTMLTEVIVVDFGSDPAIPTEMIKDPRVRVLRLEAAVWSLAEAINAGVMFATHDLIAKTDADILIAPASREGFDGLAKELQQGLFGLGLSQAIDLHQSIDVDAAAAQVASGQEPLGRLRPRWGQGGLVFFTRKTWNAVGGFDSRFTGWGNEDNDFAERVRRAGQRIRWAPRQAVRIYHVWHPPSYAATGIIGQRQRNQKLAKDDRSVLRPVVFRHSNFAEVAAPAVARSSAPLETLSIATTARPHRNRMIREAINSFRGQIDHDFEVLVVDNGSTSDETAELRRALETIRWVPDLRLECVERASIPGARNTISALARGRYICVVDDDDIALPNRLSDHLRVMQTDGMLHGSHGGWIDFDESTGLIERNGGKQRTAATLLRGSGKITAHPASFYRTDVMRAVPYDEAFALGSDLDLALRLAVLGFDIGHTASYVTLRRYHSANVTITGQANQVSNGAAARSRALASYAWTKHDGLAEQARETDKEVYCRNQLSLDSLAGLIPNYSGRWQIYVPVSALATEVPDGEPISARIVIDGTEAAKDGTEIAERLPVPQPHTPSPSRYNLALLERILDIAPGDICTRHAGLNQPIFFRSAPITGLRRAKRIKQAMEEVIDLPAHLNSVLQGELDRQVPFNWKLLNIQSGERALKSSEFTDLSALLGLLARLDGRSLLSQRLSILSDFTEQGQVYSLVTAPIRGYDELQEFKFTLERRTGMEFEQIASNGVRSELTLSARSH